MYKDDLLVGINDECTLKGQPYVILSSFLLAYSVTFRSEKVRLSRKSNTVGNYRQPLNTDTRILRTVSFVPTKSPYIFCKINPLNTNTG